MTKKARSVTAAVYKGEVVRSVHIDWEGESGYDYYILPKKAIEKATRHLKTLDAYEEDELAGIAANRAFPGACLSEHYGGPGRSFRNCQSVLSYSKYVVIISRWGYDI